MHSSTLIVAGSKGNAARNGTTHNARLAPELAAMQWLRDLTISNIPMSGSIPLEWGLPGSFPSLQR